MENLLFLVMGLIIGLLYEQCKYNKYKGVKHIMNKIKLFVQIIKQ
jgi:hypothetical protein